MKSRMPSPELLNRYCPFRSVPGCAQIQARQSSAVFDLWEAWEQETGGECPVPFWAVVWPGAMVLSKLLLEVPNLVKGREVVEIGCGGAAASIAARKAGAKNVTANDIDPVALAIAHENAARNGVEIHFSGERILTGSTARGEVILFADFFYTKSESAAFTTLMADWRGLGSTILIGDGGRPFVPQDGREILREEQVEVDSDLEGRARRVVRILRY
jgi:predicted nicotinamide N-methyase